MTGNKLQSEFFAHVIDNKVELTIFLHTGIKLSGVITAYDNDAVYLFGKGIHQLIFKDSILTVVPNKPIAYSTITSTNN